MVRSGGQALRDAEAAAREITDDGVGRWEAPRSVGSWTVPEPCCNHYLKFGLADLAAHSRSGPAGCESLFRQFFEG